VNIPDAPPYLAPLLRRLATEAETEISQHEHTPAPTEWYAGRTLDGLGGGDFGPYGSAEAAIVALVRHLWERYDEVCDERDRAEQQVAQLREDTRHLRVALTALQAERRNGAEK
jgi:hypothetical protein